MITLDHSELELDALREIANIGYGHAATALSRMVGGKGVCIDVPRVVAARKEEILPLVGAEARVLAAEVGIEGHLTGRMLLVWPEDDAREMSGLLLGPGEAAAVEEPRRSALAELANVVCSACLNAIATFTRLQLLPTSPRMIRGTGREVVDGLLPDQRTCRAAVVVESGFHGIHVPPLSIRVMVVPDRAAMPRLFRAVGL